MSLKVMVVVVVVVSVAVGTATFQQQHRCDRLLGIITVYSFQFLGGGAVGRQRYNNDNVFWLLPELKSLRIRSTAQQALPTASTRCCSRQMREIGSSSSSSNHGSSSNSRQRRTRRDDKAWIRRGNGRSLSSSSWQQQRHHAVSVMTRHPEARTDDTASSSTSSLSSSPSISTSSATSSLSLSSQPLFLTNRTLPSSSPSMVRWEGLDIPEQADNIIHTNKTLLSRFSTVVTATLILLVVMTSWNLLSRSLVIESASWRYFLAGGICAALSHAVPVPIDVIKTRKQIDYKLHNKSLWDAARVIVQTDGVASLFSGLAPTTVGYLVEGSVKFGMYEVLKPSVRRALLNLASMASFLSILNSQFLAFVICGTLSGIVASIVLCPMEAIRIRMIAQPDYAKDWIHCGLKMLSAGFNTHDDASSSSSSSSLFKGLSPMMCKQVPYTVTKNVSFDVFTRAAYAILRARGYTLTSSMKFHVPFISAMMASFLSCISSHPGDMVLSLVNAYDRDRRTVRDIVREIRQSERGMMGFFVGMRTRFLHVGIIVTLQLLIYDFIKRLCGVAATGSV